MDRGFYGGFRGLRGFIFWRTDFGSRILWGISLIAWIYFLDDGFWIADFVGDFTDCADLFFGGRILDRGFCGGLHGFRGFWFVEVIC